jgi:hypothetical protein
MQTIHTIQDLVASFEKNIIPILKMHRHYTPPDIRTEWNFFVQDCGEDRTISLELSEVAIQFDIAGAIFKPMDMLKNQLCDVPYKYGY